MERRLLWRLTWLLWESALLPSYGYRAFWGGPESERTLYFKSPPP